MITNPRVNRGLVPAAELEQTGDLILVQAKDDEGFWVNLQEPPTVKHGVAYAQSWATLHRQSTRVVVGRKRQVVREFSADQRDFTPTSDMRRMR